MEVVELCYKNHPLKDETLKLIEQIIENERNHSEFFSRRENVLLIKLAMDRHVLTALQLERRVVHDNGYSYNMIKGAFAFYEEKVYPYGGDIVVNYMSRT